MTLAPRSPSIRVQRGADSACSKVTTSRPARGASAIDGGAQHLTSDDDLLDLAGALVDAEQPGVAEEPLDRGLAQVARAAVHLDRPVRHATDHLAAEVLR